MSVPPERTRLVEVASTLTGLLDKLERQLDHLESLRAEIDSVIDRAWDGAMGTDTEEDA